MKDDFPTLLNRLHTQNNLIPYQGTVLAIDPGITIGFALFVQTQLEEFWEFNTQSKHELSSPHLEETIKKYKPDVLVVEDYRVFQGRAQQHTYSTLFTPQIIGSIHTIAALRKILVHKQQPQQAKTFITDEKLRVWKMWIPAQRHTRDAIRHGLYFLLFDARRLQLTKSMEVTDAERSVPEEESQASQGLKAHSPEEKGKGKKGQSRTKGQHVG